jgi:phage terminase large subunit
MHVSCLDSEARVDPDFVQQIIDTYGIDSNQYRVRVLGEFSLREDDVLIPAELVDARWTATSSSIPPRRSSTA